MSEKPEQLSEQAIEWMAKEGVSLTITVLPQIATIHGGGQKIGDINPNLTRIGFSVRKGEKSEVYTTEEKENTLDNLAGSMDEAYIKAKNSVMDFMFPAEPLGTKE